MKQPKTWLARACAPLLAFALAGCGDGSGDEDCSVTAQKAGLARYLDDWYFWYRDAPRPDPAAFTSVSEYLRARLYAGTNPSYPFADRFSRSESFSSFHLYYEHAEALDYGVSLNTLEAAAAPGTALRVRHVEPQGDAAAKGVQRGDEVVSINGRTAAALIAANDFSALAPAASGEQASLVLRSAGVDRTVLLRAGRHALTPVAGTSVVTTTAGRKLGYLMVKDMLFQAEAPLDRAFADLAAQSVQDLVLDLRYNGAGFVSVGRLLASYVAGARAAGQVYAALHFNDQRAARSDRSYRFVSPSRALGLSRVFVLTGARTCAAAEQVINGLRGAGLEVVTIGAATCGKPFGSEAVFSCGSVYSVVNFEVANARGEGRYFNGLAPSCRVAEDLGVPLGAGNDPLLQAAGAYADNGACPAGTLADVADPAAAAVFKEPGARSAALDR